MWVGSGRSTLCTSANEELDTLADNNTLTGYEPNFFDDYHISEATEPHIQESSGENGSLDDFEYDDVTISIALSSPLFTQEREDAASRRRAYHSHDEGLSSSQSSSVTERPVVEQFDSLIPNVRENPRRSTENEQIRILLERQKRRFSLIIEKRFRNTNSRPIMTRNIQKLSGVIESQRGEICRSVQGDEQHRRDQQLIHEQMLEQNLDLREAHERSLNEMVELKRFQGSTFDTISRRKLIEDRDTILELTGKIHELQNEINCMNDSRDFKNAVSVRSGQSHVISQPVFFPPLRDPGRMLSRSLVQEWPPSIWDIHGITGNVFCKSNGVFFSTLSARVKSMGL